MTFLEKFQSVQLRYKSIDSYDFSFDKYTNWTPYGMLNIMEFLLDNIYVSCINAVYRKIVGIRMGFNYAPAIADLFLYFFK